MTDVDIARQRLINQHISRARFTEPEQIVAWLGAVQAQDYSGAKWSLGLRLQGAREADVERAFTTGTILRTHLLRPTWHFVARDDIRWMLALTAPRVHQANAYLYRKLGLKDAVFQRVNDALGKALAGRRQLTRDELRVALDDSGVVVDGEFRMGYLMMRAELDGIVCSGARKGKQFTYALLDERVPPSRSLSRGDALARLAGRYFSSRGPATVHDLAKWSGLTITDARHGLESIQDELQHEVIDGRAYWFPTPKPAARQARSSAHLLSIYDEYLSSYKDHSAVISNEHSARLRAMGNALTRIILLNGKIAGIWKRSHKKGAVVIETAVFTPQSAADARALAKAALQYGEFHGLPAELTELSDGSS
jgi:hypothetical protein